MRLQVLSDLHLGRGAGVPPIADVDAVVLAGDIAGGTTGIEWARRWARDLPVLYVAGNHEFYGHALPGLIEELREAAAGSSVHLLENDELVLGGVRFLGCTLWSDFDFDGPERRAESMQFCQRAVNDFEHIGFAAGERALTPGDARQLHLASRRWLAERLSRRHEGPTVVITHHAPLIRTRPAAPALRALAGAFASDLTDLMGAERVALWIFGHTHRRADLEVRGTRVLSNPRGYRHERVPDFDQACVVELAPTESASPAVSWARAESSRVITSK